MTPLIRQNSRREKTACTKTASSPCRARSADGLRLLWKIGRGSLASSHAGTRLPIAVFAGPGPGRSPSARSRSPSGAPLQHALSHRPFRLKVKNSGHLTRCPPCRITHKLPTVALPTSGEGSKRIRFLSAASGSPVFVASIMTPEGGFCQAAEKGFPQVPLAISAKQAYDVDNGRRGSPLARAERKPARF